MQILVKILLTEHSLKKATTVIIIPMKQIELVYLACPYRDPDLSLRKKRCAAAHYMAAQLFAQNYYVFSPLTHNELLIELAADVPKHHWMDFDLAILAICKKLFVLKLEGWETSWGVQKEISFAREHNMPIEKLDPPEEDKFLFLMRPILTAEQSMPN